jgi:hypothetical protein
MSLINGVDEETESSVESAGSDAGGGRRVKRRRRVSVSPVVLVVLVLLVPALWVAVQAMREAAEPKAFAGNAGAIGGYTGPGEPGERYSFGITFQPLPDVTMRSGTVQTSPGSAAAATAISICRWNPDQPKDTGPIGAGIGDLAEFCTRLDPVAGRDLGELDPKDYLVLTVVPLEQGVVRVTGFELAYEQDGRSGNERFDTQIQVGRRP